MEHVNVPKDAAVIKTGYVLVQETWMAHVCAVQDAHVMKVVPVLVECKDTWEHVNVECMMECTEKLMVDMELLVMD